MNKMPEVVSARRTLDGISVFLHADGSVSDRANFLRNRVRRDMWRFWQDVCVLKHSELDLAIRTWNRPPRRRPFVIRYDSRLGMIVHDYTQVRS